MGSAQPFHPTIDVRNLSYTFPSTHTALKSISFSVPARSLTLLLGANGAGKSTLLRLLSGAKLAPSGTISIGGLDPFSQGLPGVVYLSPEWVLNPVVRTDMSVPELLDSLGAKRFPQRTEELVKILDVDLRWRMHAVSDGERRRVQLVMGLLSEWRVLFLDEVTVDLDLLCRSKILNWLKEEVSRRECTVVYATHILDGMEGWPSHLIHLSLGRVEDHGPIDQFEGETSREVKKRGHSVSRLGALLLGWLEEDLEKRGPREKGGAAEEMVKHAAEMQIGGYGFEKRPAR